MKSFLHAAALAAVLSSAGVESFAPPSRRVAVVTPGLHRPSLPSPPPNSQSTTSNANADQSHLFASKDDDDSSSSNDAQQPSRRSSKFLTNVRRKSKPITLALLTATTLRSLLLGASGPSSSSTFLLPPPAQASAPIVLRENAKKEDPPLVKADKEAEKIKKRKSIEEFDAFMARANDIEEAEGKKARDEFETQYQLDREAKEARKKRDVESLKRKLLDGGQDPNTDVDGQRQVFLLEHDVNLDKISGTPQNEQMIKNFQKRGKNLPTFQSQRYIIACQVSDLKARGIDPMTHFSQQEVQEKTRAIYRMDDKVAARVAGQYESLMGEYGGRLTPAQAGEVPFVYSGESDAAASVAGAAVASSSASGSGKAEKAAAREARAAEKETAREARARAKAERADGRAQAKADKAAAKEGRLAEKAAASAAAAAVASAASGAANAVSSITDGDVAATANGDVSAAAGNNAVFESNVVVKEEQTSSNKAKDAVSTVKSYATPRNVATVVIGGGAAAYGINYYQENNDSAQADRERQLKLILGNDEDDDEEDDDDFDDDEDDEYEQFTKKKTTPSQSKPDDTPKAEVKSPSTPPPVPTPAPKPKRKLGIFAKRNANARETDLNSLVAPNAVGPEFATLLAQILTFGAPGRFPAVASWGTMPLEKFDLDAAKSLLTESRGNADLTDEQSAEIFASVVNCMIIDIVDLASSTLKGKNKDDKVAVDAINVVMDFMDHAASLFDAVAKDVTIKPVTYGGNLRKKDLEQMFSVYAGSSMMSLDALSGGGGTSQDRVDTLQLVFAIADKKAEGLMQKHMMSMMMNLMKDGGKGLEGMMPEGMEGMEGMEEMMKAMGGAEGMGGMGMPGMDGEVSPEELKQTLGMMKELMDSGQVSEEELVEVRSQFKEMYGSDISDLIKKAQDEGDGEGGMSEDERELLKVFKQILGEE